MNALDIQPCILNADCEALRLEVREFIAEHIPDYPAEQRARNWSHGNAEFSRKLGERGWLGMTWPKAFGGHERSSLERYVVLEELLAAGAPVGWHWVADRQSGPLLMRFAKPEVAHRLVPKIARGELSFCIGMSEPDSGSDLASIRSKAEKTLDGWRLNGRKVWTSGAHRAHYAIALLRTDPNMANKHSGVSQFLIDMKTPGITIRPIKNMVGERDFNEVVFDDVELPDECLIGGVGEGWKQVTAELAFERSGPERYMSNTQLVIEMLDAAHQLKSNGDTALDRHEIELGRIVAEYATLRQMTLGLAGMLARGENPATAAALTKDQGALLEQRIPELAHNLFGDRDERVSPSLSKVMNYTTQASVSYSLRGGTREIMRGIIARGLDLR
jgi:acyl-CoA dehydrogenase